MVRYFVMSDYANVLLINMLRQEPRQTRLPYTTLFRSGLQIAALQIEAKVVPQHIGGLIKVARRQLVRLDVQRGQMVAVRSEEHTSELQSRFDLVCRLLLEKKKIS